MNMVIEIIDGVAYAYDKTNGLDLSCDLCALDLSARCSCSRMCRTDDECFYRLLTADERQQVIAALGRGIK